VGGQPSVRGRAVGKSANCQVTVELVVMRVGLRRPRRPNLPAAEWKRRRRPACRCWIAGRLVVSDQAGNRLELMSKAHAGGVCPSRVGRLATEIVENFRHACASWDGLFFSRIEPTHKA